MHSNADSKTQYLSEALKKHSFPILYLKMPNCPLFYSKTNKNFRFRLKKRTKKLTDFDAIQKGLLAQLDLQLVTALDFKLERT